mmetsp:Transcript_40133/g.111513  ORF Transcript_40133/g.111513 Transcript_40133/m.111513 type:complete len:243 (-) Transcript_40133:506-1234(-)
MTGKRSRCASSPEKAREAPPHTGRIALLFSGALDPHMASAEHASGHRSTSAAPSASRIRLALPIHVSRLGVLEHAVLSLAVRPIAAWLAAEAVQHLVSALVLWMSVVAPLAVPAVAHDVVDAQLAIALPLAVALTSTVIAGASPSPSSVVIPIPAVLPGSPSFAGAASAPVLPIVRASPPAAAAPGPAVRGRGPGSPLALLRRALAIRRVAATTKTLAPRFAAFLARRRVPGFAPGLLLLLR